MDFDIFALGIIAVTLSALTVPLILVGDRLTARARTSAERAVAFAPIGLGIATLAIFVALILFNVF